MSKFVRSVFGTSLFSPGPGYFCQDQFILSGASLQPTYFTDQMHNLAVTCIGISNAKQHISNTLGTHLPTGFDCHLHRHIPRHTSCVSYRLGSSYYYLHTLSHTHTDTNAAFEKQPHKHSEGQMLDNASPSRFLGSAIPAILAGKTQLLVLENSFWVLVPWGWLRSTSL